MQTFRVAWAAGVVWLCLTIPMVGGGVLDEVTELSGRSFLDDHQSQVVQGWLMVTATEKYASRYAGNRLRCSQCHLEGGTKAGALPLYVAGIYPKWRAKNGRMNDLSRRIRECFVYSLDGVMPPAEAPEVVSVEAYIQFISRGQVIGQDPPGRGVPVLPPTGFDPNPADGRKVYQQKCAGCHGEDGHGLTDVAPPLWGSGSFNKGAGLHQLSMLAGFIHANMPVGEPASLSLQQAWDVAAFIHQQIRPADPRESRLGKLVEKLVRLATP
ncbi:MAG: c-type cytochrome [Magnetococcales bacterium]|nr:c-type cytochrome [Magnetococcales bacterium]NGZ25813.1 c-type cytochrome [Magnetococcales bacterium]